MLCSQTHVTKYDALNVLYVTVLPNIFFINTNDMHLGAPENPGITWYMLTVTHTPAARYIKKGVFAQKRMHYIEDNNMNRAIATQLLGLICGQECKGFEEDLRFKPKVKFSEVFNNFWDIYGVVRGEEMSDNLEMKKNTRNAATT